MKEFLQKALGDVTVVDKETKEIIAKTLRRNYEAILIESREIIREESSPEQDRAAVTLGAIKTCEDLAREGGIDAVLGNMVGALMGAIQIMIRSRMARDNATDTTMVKMGMAPYKNSELGKTVGAIMSVAMKVSHMVVMGFDDLPTTESEPITDMPAKMKEEVLGMIGEGRVDISDQAKGAMDELGISEDDIMRMVRDSLLQS